MNLVFNKYYTNFRFVFSGKSAINLIFSYLKEKNIIISKLDEVLVPKLMGNWVYSQLNQVTVPSPSFNKKIKMIYLYHQFGIPQRIDKIINQKKKFIIIEDCAHILYGHFKNKQIGHIGDYVLFSYSKFFNINALGGVSSKKISFLKYVDNRISKTNKYPYYLIQIIFLIKKIFKKNEFFQEILNSLAYSLYNYSFFPRTGSIKKIQNIYKKEIKLRIQRLQQTRKYLRSLGVIDYDKSSDKYAPYAIPIILNKNNLKKLILNYKKYNIDPQIVKFDINRNLFNPKYKDSILLDISKDENFFLLQIELIIKTLKKNSI